MQTTKKNNLLICRNEKLKGMLLKEVGITFNISCQATFAGYFKP